MEPSWISKYYVYYYEHFLLKSIQYLINYKNKQNWKIDGELNSRPIGAIFEEVLIAKIIILRIADTELAMMSVAIPVHLHINIIVAAIGVELSIITAGIKTGSMFMTLVSQQVATFPGMLLTFWG